MVFLLDSQVWASYVCGVLILAIHTGEGEEADSEAAWRPVMTHKVEKGVTDFCNP